MAYPYYPQNYPQQNYPQQTQNGGFVRVKDETEAMNYPVAPGYSVTFIDETATHFFVKTAGLSQFDRPTFDRYRLVKEQSPEEVKIEYATKQDIEELKAQIKALKGETTDE